MTQIRKKNSPKQNFERGIIGSIDDELYKLGITETSYIEQRAGLASFHPPKLVVKADEYRSLCLRIEDDKFNLFMTSKLVSDYDTIPHYIDMNEPDSIDRVLSIFVSECKPYHESRA